MKLRSVYGICWPQRRAFSVIAKYCLHHKTVKINDANVVSRTQMVYLMVYKLTYSVISDKLNLYRQSTWQFLNLNYIIFFSINIFKIYDGL